MRYKQLEIELHKRDAQIERLQKKLELLEEEYKNFAYMMSHDISGHMRSIEGFSNIILKNHGDKFDEKTRKHFQYITDSASEIKTILPALLEYSRFNDKQKETTRINCHKIVNQVKRELDDMIRQSGAEIIADRLPNITGYENQIHQLFYILLHNALLYQPKGNKPKIKIFCLEKYDHWKFCIRDNGIGLDEKSFGYSIFMPLKRAVSKKEYPGIGMGLAIADKIVHNHKNGGLWFRSGDGASFYFVIGKERRQYGW